MTTSPTAPAITDALRAEARANPGSWIYAVDPGFEGSADVPPQGIVGAWRSDDEGRLSDDFTPNPNYLATPQARGWTQPRTELERTLQLVLTGYQPDGRLVSAFASADVFVFSRPEGGLFLAPSQDGGSLVYAYTDAEKAAATGYAETRRLRGAELAAELPEGVCIALNAGERVSAIVDPAEAVAAG